MIIRYGSVAFMASVVMISSWQFCEAQQQIDILGFFQKARADDRVGTARKTKAVDVREARLDEIVVTNIKGQGKETQSPPAMSGDKVVRNRCPETGNEEILVSAANFAKRYEGPTGTSDEKGWLPYRPRGVQMRFLLTSELDGAFTFTAPWGENMIARPGDAIVQDPENPKDTYRIQKDAFVCTYEIFQHPTK